MVLPSCKEWCSNGTNTTGYNTGLDEKTMGEYPFLFQQPQTQMIDIPWPIKPIHDTSELLS